MHLSEPVEVGKTYTIEFREPGVIRTGVPIYVIREATEEEWVQDRVEQGYDEQSVRQGLERHKAAFPSSKVYEVSVD